MSVSTTPFKGILPTGGTAVALATATLSAGNTWYQLVASTSATIYLTGVVAWIQSSNGGSVDIGTGGAGAEIVVAQFYAYGASSNTYPPGYYFALPFPLRIPSGTRIAMRSTAAAGNIAVTYVSESAVI